MKQKTTKPSYEAPHFDIYMIEAEGLLCVSTASGQNEPYMELEDEYIFKFN